MAGLLYDGYAEATRADCIGLDTTVPLHWAAQAIQQRLGRCVQGNLDPMVLLEGGAAMTAEVDLSLRAASEGPFIFNLGHGIDKATQPDHVAALVEQVKAWRRTSPVVPSARSKSTRALITASSCSAG